MRNLACRISIVVLSAASSVAIADQPYGTTVQLPTFNSFSVVTTVSVPDRGGAYLGGIGRAYSGRNENGVPIVGKLPFVGPIFGGRAIGSSVSDSGAMVHATIIDHEELDRIVLAEAAKLRGTNSGNPSTRPAKAESLARPVDPELAHRPFESLAAIKARNAAEDAVRERQLAEAVQKAETAEQAGKYAAARGYYLMAAKLCDGRQQRDLKDHAARMGEKAAEAKRK